MKLEFEEEGHIYRLDGAIVPSVTQVLACLEAWDNVPRDALEAARELGTHVHAACHLFNRGELDWATLDPVLLPYVRAWEKFLEDKSATIIGSEVRVAHPKLGFAGTVDTLIDVRGYDWLCDIKTAITVSRAVGPQTAGYEMMLGKKFRRYCVQLFADGTYRLWPLKSPTDLSIFVSCLNLWKWKHNTKLR